MSTLSNYEGLLALSTSPILTKAMRGYLVGVLAEHREMRLALSAIVDDPALVCSYERLNSARAILAKVEA